METTVLDCLPWLSDKLTAEQIDELDKYLADYIDDGISEIPWDVIADKYQDEILYATNQGVDLFLSTLKNINFDAAWRYHIDHGHMGRLDMCKDEVCLMVNDIMDSFAEKALRLYKLPQGENGIYSYEAYIKTVNSEGLYYWLLQRADHIKVLAPENVKQELIRKIKAMLLVYEE